MQYDECSRTSMVLKFLDYISCIKMKKTGPSSGSLYEKKCILLSVLNSVCTVKGVKAMQSSLVAECGLNSVCDVVVGVIAAV